MSRRRGEPLLADPASVRRREAAAERNRVAAAERRRRSGEGAPAGVPPGLRLPPVRPRGQDYPAHLAAWLAWHDARCKYAATAGFDPDAMADHGAWQRPEGTP